MSLLLSLDFFVVAVEFIPKFCLTVSGNILLIFELFAINIQKHSSFLYVDFVFDIHNNFT